MAAPSSVRAAGLRRRRGGGAAERRPFAQNSLAPITRLPGAGAVPGLCRDFDALLSSKFQRRRVWFPQFPRFPIPGLGFIRLCPGPSALARSLGIRQTARPSDRNQRQQIGATGEDRGTEGEAGRGGHVHGFTAGRSDRGGVGEQVGLIMPIHSFPASIQPGIAIALPLFPSPFTPAPLSLSLSVPPPFPSNEKSVSECSQLVRVFHQAARPPSLPPSDVHHTTQSSRVPTCSPSDESLCRSQTLVISI